MLGVRLSLRRRHVVDALTRIPLVHPVLKRIAPRPDGHVLLGVLAAVAGAGLLGVAATWWPSMRAPESAVQDGDPVVVASYVFEGAKQEALYVEQFAHPPTPGRRYTLVVTNGAPDGSARVNRATVVLNGAELFGPSGVTQATDEVRRPVGLRDVNVLEVTVTGKVGTSVRVTVWSERDPTFVVFGPQIYVRQRQGPTTFGEAFAIAATAAAPYAVHVSNGAADGSGRISIASLVLNGVDAVSPEDFNQQVDYVERGVNLQTENTLTVELESTPGAYLTVWVTATDVTPPVLTLGTPPEQLFTSSDEVEVAGTVEDETHTEVTVNGELVTVGQDGSFSVVVPLGVEGENAIEVVATDAAGFSSTVSRVVVYDPHPPVLTVTTPSDGFVTKDDEVTVSGTVFDDTPVDVNVNGVPLPADGAGLFTGSVALAEGANVLTVTATDAAGNSVSVVRIVTRDTEPPVLAVTEPANGSSTTEETVTVSGTVTDALTDVTVTVNGVTAVIDGETFSVALVPLTEGVNVVTVVATDAAGNTATQTVTVTRETPTGGLPPDPSTVAPDLDLTVATTMPAATGFLYEGDPPIQTGVAAGTITPVRAAVIRGQVLDENGDPLPGATITVLHHPEYGQTLSREDGWFDLAVNGGGRLTVDYQKASYLTVQRPVDVPWQDFAFAEDAVMVPLDPQVTVVTLPASTVQVARGTPQTDVDGTRQATLLFMPGTTAEMVLPGGSVQPLATLSVRATEYTVGELGPQRMPAPLPLTSGYTYSPEFSVDEALAAGATEVRFSQPVVFYLENFVGFAVGGIVPAGYYDRSRGAWIAVPNGRVIAVLGVTGGLADLDLTGSGVPATLAEYEELGITEQEREQLALLYAPGTTLWRVHVDHFSPWECNWPYGPPEDAENPDQPPPEEDEEEDDDCESEGSIIECHNQVLGERIPLVGSGFGLNYRSDRVPGRVAAYTLDIPLSGATLPASLWRIILEVHIAGRRFRETFPAAPNQRTTFTWDGRDAYGRLMQGEQTVRVRVGWEYQAVFYREPAERLQAFLRMSESGTILEQSRDGLRFYAWQTWSGTLGTLNVRELGLGGWTLGVHHAYDPVGKVLYLGDGGRRSTMDNRVIEAFAGSGVVGANEYPSVPYGDGGPATEAQFELTGGVTAGPDGTVYVADYLAFRIRKVSPDGIITTFAGDGTFCSDYPSCGDGGPATSAQVYPWLLATGPDGSIYFSDEGPDFVNSIRRISPDGVVSTVVGNGTRGYSGDDGPATEAQISSVDGLVVGPDGTLYLSDAGWYRVDGEVLRSHRVRAVGTDGIITTIAGSGTRGYTGDGGPAASALLNSPGGLAVDREGNLYISQWLDHVIRKVTPDGTISTVVGTGNRGPWDGPAQGDGGPATSADLYYGDFPTVDRDGNLYFTEPYRVRVVSPDGIIRTMAGSGVLQPWRGGWPGDEPSSDGGDGGYAPAASFTSWGIYGGLAVGPDGSVYVPDNGDFRVRRIAAPLPGFSGSDITVASEDGMEVYRFDAEGRHLQTVHTLTGAVLYDFAYDALGYLTSVRDVDDRVTSIERDGAGIPVAIVAPFGQRSELRLDENGYLAAVINPAAETVQLGTDALGLLSTLTLPRGHTSTFTFNDAGYLTRDEDPVGGWIELALDGTQSESRVTKTTALGRASTYERYRARNGQVRYVNAFPDGTSNETIARTDGTDSLVLSDGTRIWTSERPDPRFGMQSALISEEIETPSGLRSVVERTRTVVLTDPNDLLSVESITDSVDANGRLYTRVFDAGSHRITTTSPAGREAVIEIDAQGRTTKYEPSGAMYPVYVSYYPQGGVAAILYGPGDDPNVDRRYAIEYGAGGYVRRITDPTSEWAQYLYDGAGRLTSTLQSDGREVTFAWDGDGNTISVTPPGRSAHSFNYTERSQVQSYVPPAVPGIPDPATVYNYNLDRQLELLQRPGGLEIDPEYDAISGRLVRSLLPGSEQISYELDQVTGQVRGILRTPAGVTVQRTHDGRLLTSEAWQGEVQGSVDRSYDANFVAQTVSVNSGGFFTATRSYDRDTLVTGVSVSMSEMPSNPEFSIERDPATGLVIGTTVGTVATVYAHNGFGELSTHTVRANSSVLYEAVYHSGSSPRDKLGRIVEAVESVAGTVRSSRYSYDRAGRLIDVWQNGDHISHYTYDGNDNRTSYTRENEAPISAADILYDQQDRLIRYGGVTYAYGDEGHLQSMTDGGAVTTYEHDALGNLRAVVLPDGRRIDYVLDGLGRRIGVKHDGRLIQGFLYKDELNPVAELDENGDVVSVFVYATEENVPDVMISRKVDGNNWVPYRIIADIRGSPLLVINAVNGDVVQRMEYTEFGEIRIDTRPGFQPFGFTGGLYDGYTALTHLGNREYDPTIGRWTTKDPILFLGGSTNLYSYANGDPVNLIDPTGLGAFSCDPPLLPILGKPISQRRFLKRWRCKCRRERKDKKKRSRCESRVTDSGTEIECILDPALWPVM